MSAQLGKPTQYKIGDHRLAWKSCGARLPNHCKFSGQKGCRAQFGPEWDCAGYNKHAKCGAFGAKSKTMCKKVRYTGKLADCCLNRVDKSSWTTCDPNYINFGSACNEVFWEHCNKGDLLFTDDRCKKWGDRNPREYDLLMKAKCDTKDGLQRPECRAWCQENPTKCDNGAEAYCQLANSDAKFCSCYRGPLISDAISNAAPACYDKTCRNYGYKNNANQTMLDHCPSIINCTQNLDFAEGAEKNFLEGVQMSQSCKSTPPKPDPPSAPSKPSTPPKPSQPSKPSTPSTPSKPSQPSKPSTPSKPSQPDQTDPIHPLHPSSHPKDSETPFDLHHAGPSNDGSEVDHNISIHGGKVTKDGPIDIIPPFDPSNPPVTPPIDINDQPTEPTDDSSPKINPVLLVLFFFFILVVFIGVLVGGGFIAKRFLSRSG